MYHGGSKLLNYITSLNSYNTDGTEELKKIILVNNNHIFDPIIRQYDVFDRLGLGRLSSKFQAVNSLSECLPIINEVRFYER